MFANGVVFLDTWPIYLEATGKRHSNAYMIWLSLQHTREKA